MTELAPPQAGPANWSHGFLPPNFQGTRLRPTGSPLLDLEPPAYKSREHQRSSLDQLAMLNERHARLHPEHAALRGRMASCELAYRMQMAVPGIIDLEREPRHVLRAYGVDRKETAARSAASACWLGVWSNRGFGSCRSFPVGGTATTI